MVVPLLESSAIFALPFAGEHAGYRDFRTEWGGAPTARSKSLPNVFPGPPCFTRKSVRREFVGPIHHQNCNRIPRGLQFQSELIDHGNGKARQPGGFAWRLSERHRSWGL